MTNIKRELFSLRRKLLLLKRSAVLQKSWFYYWALAIKWLVENSPLLTRAYDEDNISLFFFCLCNLGTERLCWCWSHWLFPFSMLLVKITFFRVFFFFFFHGSRIILPFWFLRSRWSKSKVALHWAKFNISHLKFYVAHSKCLQFCSHMKLPFYTKMDFSLYVISNF